MLSYNEIMDSVLSLEIDFKPLRDDARNRYALYTRRREPDISPEIAREGQVDMLSPMVTYAANTIRADLLMNPTEFMTIPLARERDGRIPKDDAKKADNLERALAIIWSRINDGRRVDREIIWHQLVSPFGVMILECGEREVPSQPDGMSAKVYTHILENWEREWMPWSVITPDPMTCAFQERSGKPTIFVRRYKQLIRDVERLYSRKRGDFEDMDLRFDGANWVWKRMSDDYEPSVYFQSMNSLKECEMLWLDDGVNIYHVALGLYGKGGQIVWQGQNPIGRVSAFVVSGSSTPFRNPQDKYEPYLLPLMQVVDQINNIRTTRATASRNVSGPRTYIPLDPEIVKMYEAAGKKLPVTHRWKANETPYLLGPVMEAPAHVDPDLDKIEGALLGELERLMPSPFVHIVDPAVLKAATATSILHAAETGLRMYGPLMSAYDSAIKSLCEGIVFSAVNFYDEDARVYAYATGEEMARGKNLTEGNIYFLNAEAADFSHRLQVKTRSMTQAQAAAQYDSVLKQWILPDGRRGPATFEDLVDAANYTDKAAQIEKRAAEDILDRIDPVIDQMALAQFYAKMKSKTGMDLPLIPGAEQQESSPSRLPNSGQRMDAPFINPLEGGSEATMTGPTGV